MNLREISATFPAKRLTRCYLPRSLFGGCCCCCGEFEEFSVSRLHLSHFPSIFRAFSCPLYVLIIVFCRLLIVPQIAQMLWRFISWPTHVLTICRFCQERSMTQLEPIFTAGHAAVIDAPTGDHSSPPSPPFPLVAITAVNRKKSNFPQLSVWQHHHQKEERKIRKNELKVKRSLGKRAIEREREGGGDREREK